MSTIRQSADTPRRLSPFVMAFIINFLWINASEVFRYFAFIMPMMRDAFKGPSGKVGSIGTQIG